MQTPPPKPAATTYDPFLYLGTDLFVEVLSHLGAHDLLTVELVSHPWNDCAQVYSCGLWRRASLRAGVEYQDICACDSLAANGHWTVGKNDSRPVATDLERLLEPPKIRHWATRSVDTPGLSTPTPLETPLAEGARVNWRYVCQEHTELQTGWRNGRCRLRWITPRANTVWRIKANLEQDVLMCTSRMHGLLTVDRATSDLLFSIAGLEGYAHLEAGNGFIVFDTPGNVQPLAGFQVDDANSNTALEVWRTGDARERATQPRQGRSTISSTAASLTHAEFVPGSPDSPLPRGHLEHYRTLQPPARCLAFRLHVDGADTANPRAIVAAAGSDAMFLWHLEENREMQKIERGWQDNGRPNYIELDDEFAFICLDQQMHVYSRQTLKHLASFPPLGVAAKDAAVLAFPLSLAHDFVDLSDAEKARATMGKTADGVPAPVQRAIVTGGYDGDPVFNDAIGRGIQMYSSTLPVDQPDNIEYGFTAVHFTTTDLVCTARSGAVFIVRHYARVFREAAALPVAKRAQHIAANTVIIGLNTTIRQLTTYRDHVIVCTSFNVIVFEGDSLPDLVPATEREAAALAEPIEVDADPSPDSPVSTAASTRPASASATPPQFRAHVLLGNHPQAMKMSSCIQADARSVYLTYWATGEMDAIGGSDPGNPSFPPEPALDGFGMCVKVWTFGPD